MDLWVLTAILMMMGWIFGPHGISEVWRSAAEEVWFFLGVSLRVGAAAVLAVLGAFGWMCTRWGAFGWNFRVLGAYVCALSVGLFAYNFLVLMRLVPVEPVWDFAVAFAAAPLNVAGAISRGGLAGLDAELGEVWRPTLWGVLWYRDLCMLSWQFVRYRSDFAQFVRQSALEDMVSSTEVMIAAMLYATILACVLLVGSGAFTSPLTQPYWFYLHSCAWAGDAYFHTYWSRAPPRLDQWLALVILAWTELGGIARLATTPLVAQFTAASGFDMDKFLEEEMRPGGFTAEMEDVSSRPKGCLAQLLRTTSRTTSRLFLPGSEAVAGISEKRRRLAEGSIARHGGRVMPACRFGPVSRQNIVESSLSRLRSAGVPQLLSRAFVVTFEGEQGLDLGGVTRDWYDGLARALVDGSELCDGRHLSLASSSLLSYATDGTLLPRPSGYLGAEASEAPEELLERWRRLAAVGRFLGVAVLQNQPLPMSFGSVLMKIMCEQAVPYSDVRHLDPDFYRHRIDLILQEGGLAQANEALAGDPLTFMSAPTELMPTQVPLVEGGERIQVTEENKMEYIALLSEARICSGRRHELQAFVSGFHEVIPADLLREAGVSPSELSLLISGVHRYDVEDWRRHAQQSGDAQVLAWFWEQLGAFTQQQRAHILQFSTGSSRIPVGGFKDMRPLFTVCVTGAAQTQLPIAHTCINKLALPRYSSQEQLAHKLAKIASLGSDAGFGFG